MSQALHFIIILLLTCPIRQKKFSISLAMSICLYVNDEPLKSIIKFNTL